MLVQMKQVLNGDGGPSASAAQAYINHRLIRVGFAAEYEPAPDAVAQLAQEVYASDLLHLLVLNIWRFEFEASRRPLRELQPSPRE